MGIRKALDFTQGYVELQRYLGGANLLDGTNDFTVEIKLTPRTHNGTGWAVCNYIGGRQHWFMAWESSINKYGLYWHTYGTGDITLNVDDVLDVDREYHVSFVFNASGDAEIFVDGSLVGSTTAPSAVAITTNREYLGYPNALESFCGEMRDFRIWNIARTAVNILADMHTNLTGSETNLVAHYPMDEGSGIAISDSTGTYEDGYFINEENHAKNVDFDAWAGGAAANPDSFASWSADSSHAIARESTIKYNSNYSAKLTRNGANCFLYQGVFHWDSVLADWIGKTIRFGIWAYATVANRARVLVGDGVSSDVSGYHSGGSNWEFLTAEITVDAAATGLRVDFKVDNGDTSVYWDQLWVTEVIDVWTVIGGTVEVELDALIQQTGITKTTSLNALLKRTNITRTTDLNALLQILSVSGTDLDAALSTIITKGTDLDAHLEFITKAEALLDAVLQGLNSKDTSIDAMLGLEEIKKITSLDALLEKGDEATFNMDAILTLKKTIEAGLDALLVNVITSTMSIDGILSKSWAASGMDGIIWAAPTITYGRRIEHPGKGSPAIHIQLSKRAVHDGIGAPAIFKKGRHT